MHLCLSGRAFILAILIALQLDLSEHTRVLEPKYKWNCSSYYHEYLCKPINEDCQPMIDKGEPCSMAEKYQSNIILCINTSSSHEHVKKCLLPLDEETDAKKGHCHQTMYHPVGIGGAICKSFTGKIIDTVEVLTEFQCMDLCMRNWRCVAFNIFKSSDKPRPCQLLESYSVSSEAECMEDYIGKKLDRQAFYQAYLNPGCKVQEVT